MKTSIAQKLAAFFALSWIGIATVPSSHAFTLTCNKVTIGDSADGTFIAAINFGQREDYGAWEGDTFLSCETRKGDTVFLSPKTRLDFGAFYGDPESQKAILSCPFVSLKQLKKRNERVLWVAGAEAGLAGEAGINLGFDERGNFCYFLEAGFGLGAHAGIDSYEISFKGD